MKNVKLSLLAFALVTMFTVSLTSCGSKNDDPTPITVKTDLEKVQDGLLNIKIHTFKAEITTSTGVVPIQDLCNPGAAYANSVEEFTFTFTDKTKVHATNECVHSEIDLTYTVSQSGNIFNVQMKTTSSGSIVVDAYFNITDLLDANGIVLSTIKGQFKEIVSPKNWEKSPVIFLEKK